MNNIRSKLIKKTGIAIVVVLILGLFISFTNPQDLPIALLIVPFILFFVLVKVVAGLIIGLLFINLSKLKARAISNSISLLLLFILVLNSLGQFTWKDLILSGVLSGLLGFYFYKSDLL